MARSIESNEESNQIFNRMLYLLYLGQVTCFAANSVGENSTLSFLAMGQAHALVRVSVDRPILAKSLLVPIREVKLPRIAHVLSPKKLILISRLYA